jgi:hypothetical protein
VKILGFGLGFIFDVLVTSMDLLGSDHLWHLENDPIFKDIGDNSPTPDNSE